MAATLEASTRRPSSTSPRNVIHAGQGFLWACVVALGAGTACAILSLQDIRWLAGTFGLLVLATLALWRWVAASIILDGQGILIGRMFGLDTKIAYRDMARVRFIRVETGDAGLDWRVQNRITGLSIPFETQHPQGHFHPHAHGPLLMLRIEPKAKTAKQELRLDLGRLADAHDIQLLYDRLPQQRAQSIQMPVW